MVKLEVAPDISPLCANTGLATTANSPAKATEKIVFFNIFFLLKLSAECFRPAMVCLLLIGTSWRNKPSVDRTVVELFAKAR